jgi:hypothetical protein
VRHALRNRLVAVGLLAAACACGERAPRDAGGSTARDGGVPPAAAPARDTAPGRDTAPTPPRASPSVAAAESPAGALDSLARRQALKAALHDVHEALVSYYARNARYPADRKELETDPSLAASVAELEKASTGVTYSSDGGSFKLTITRADGAPVTLSGNNQRHQRKPPPPVSRPAGA